MRTHAGPKPSHELEFSDAHDHYFLKEDPTLKRNQRKTLLVGFLTIVVMLTELTFGYLSSSMALLAEGWHMASHTGVLIITYLTYRFANSDKVNERFSFGAGKIIPLGGYTNAIILAMVAIFLIAESVERLINPAPVNFNEAISVALIGLLANMASAFVLGRGNHFHHHVYAEDHPHDHSHPHHDEPKHEHQHDPSHGHHKPDINIHSAFIHILADTLVTVLTVTALFAGRYFDSPRLDAIMALVGSVVILRWAYGLSRETLWDLLDGHAKHVDRDKLKSSIEDGNTKIVDLHVWRVAPKAHACEMVIRTTTKKGSLYYRKLIPEYFQIKHLTIEEIGKEG